MKREGAEAEAQKAIEDLWEARESADAANTARVSAEGDVETLQAAMGEVEQELKEFQLSEVALHSEC